MLKFKTSKENYSGNKGLLLLHGCRSSFGKATHGQKQVTKSNEREKYRKNRQGIVERTAQKKESQCR